MPVSRAAVYRAAAHRASPAAARVSSYSVEDQQTAVRPARAAGAQARHNFMIDPMDQALNPGVGHSAGCIGRFAHLLDRGEFRLYLRLPALARADCASQRSGFDGVILFGPQFFITEVSSIEHRRF